MVTIMQEEWIADLGSMTCKNISNKIVVSFKKYGNSIRGKIKYIPIKLFAQWAAEPHGEYRIQEAVLKAEKVFMRACFESETSTI